MPQDEEKPAESLGLSAATPESGVPRRQRHDDPSTDQESIDPIHPTHREKPIHIDSSDDGLHVDEDENGHESGSDNNEGGVRPEQYRRVSSFARTASIVPRAERRGLLGRFTIIPEIENPYEYTNKTKWLITAIVALAAAAAPMGSGIFYPALPQMALDLHSSGTVTNLTVAMYMLAMSIFPLWWSSFSETLGRRTIYVVSFSLFIVFSIASALSVNISMLIVMRILGGGASASVQAVGAGTIADIWEPSERGRAMGIFYLGPLTGPLFAPVIGGALAERYGWRATMWFLTIYGGVTLIMLVFGLPETLVKRAAPAVPPNPSMEPSTIALRKVSTAQSVKIHTKRVAAIAKRLFADPLLVLTYLRYPAVLVTVYSASIAFGALFILNISISTTFSAAPYDWSTILVGLLYLPPSLGYVVASAFGGRWLDYIMAREAQKAGRYDGNGKLIYLPEDRMSENMWLAATMYPAALVWYGWSAEKGLPWIVPCIANFFFGCGSMLVFGAATTMLTEFMPRKSSSGVAVNNFVRNIFSCVGGIVSKPLIDAMGNGWLCTMVGLFAWITGNAAIWALKRRAPAWRVSMDNALSKKG